LERRQLQRGDLLVVEGNGSEKEIGRCALWSGEIDKCVHQNHIIRCRPVEPALGPFTLLFLNSPSGMAEMRKLAITTSGLYSLSVGKIRGIAFPLPPLAEQNRIVARVDQLMALIDELEAKQTRKREVGAGFTKASLEALTTAEGPAEFDAAWKRLQENWETVLDRSEKVATLREAIIELAVRGALDTRGVSDQPATLLLAKLAVTRAKLSQRGRSRVYKDETDNAPVPLFTTPKGWEWTKVATTFEVCGGIQKTPLRSPKANHFPYLRVENVQRGRLDLERVERFELQDGELERWQLRAGDLLVVEGNGSEREIGRCALWSGEIYPCVHQNHLIRCRPLEPALGPFALLFLNSPSGMAEMRKLAITTSGLYSLSVGKIRSISLPLPPLDEQKRIVTKVATLMELCDGLEAKLRRAEAGASKLVAAVVHEVMG
jgi:type I restriction enzyme, S subunit